MEESKDQQTKELEQIFKDRYSNYVFLSQGGMGKVFTARDNILDKQIVIKILQNSFDDNQAFIRFQREAQVSSKLTHSNIVGTLDFGITEKNFPYIVMDFIDGKSLQEILVEEKTIPEAVAVTIARQIARGMAYAHSKGIVHRDLKTANIIVSNYPENPHATIIDFGLARRENQGESSGKLTRLGTIIGTPLYMSPEQASGKQGDERSDIYSLGCILFKMLTGHTPFEGGESITIIREKTLHEAPALTQSNPDITFSSDLEEVVAKALSLEPESRQQSMALLEKELVSSQTERKNSTVDIELPEIKENKFEKLIYVALALLLLAGTGGFGFYLFQSNSDNSQDKNARKEEKEKFVRAFQMTLHSPKHASLEAKSDVSDEDLEALAQSYETNSFRILDLKNTNITGSGLIHIAKLPIPELDLTGTKIEQRYYKVIARMPNLQKLNLQGSTISGEGLSYLAEAESLKYLSLNSCKDLKHGDLIHLKDMRLSVLDLVSTPIDDSDLVPISKIKSLEDILLDNNEITDRAFDILKPCRNLRDIKISKCAKITSEGLEKICTYWPDLSSLSIAYLNLKVEDLKPLYNLRHLTYINMMNLPIRDEDTDWMVKNKALRFIYLSDTRLTNQGLKNLTKLNGLKIFSMLNSGKKTDKVSKEALHEASKIWIEKNSDFRIYTDIDPSLSVGGKEALEFFDISTEEANSNKQNSSPSPSLDF